MEWWQRLNLKDDPFGKTGNPNTGNIDYIVETSIYKKYQNRINYIDSFFGAVTAICGEYGSGKSTFFDYLQNKFKLLDKNIETISLPVSTYSSNGKEIFDLVKYLLNLLIGDPQKENIEFVDISNALTIRCHERNLYGHIIFIDELHHNPNVDAIFEFFKLSQGLTEYLFKHNKIGFFIAGHSSWIERLKKPTYRGPIDIFEIMDEINVDQAYQIVNKRIIEFVINPKYKQEKYIEKEAIVKIYNSLSQNTPRQLIIETGEAFSYLPETKMILTSTDISQYANTQTIEAVRKKLIAIPLVHRKLNSIITNYQTDEEKNIALRFISKLYDIKSIDKVINQ
ncbi:MAG: ATP-binding protein, partial [Candidatus Thermoplasmatota archaeon]|nr:ATP-binding protein [Candidatus Thermoplasmatota archaeon]